jgi:hypothetical protein
MAPQSPIDLHKILDAAFLGQVSVLLDALQVEQKKPWRGSMDPGDDQYIRVLQVIMINLRGVKRAKDRSQSS